MTLTLMPATTSPFQQITARFAAAPSISSCRHTRRNSSEKKRNTDSGSTLARKDRRDPRPAHRELKFANCCSYLRCVLSDAHELATPRSIRLDQGGIIDRIRAVSSMFAEMNFLGCGQRTLFDRAKGISRLFFVANSKLLAAPRERQSTLQCGPISRLVDRGPHVRESKALQARERRSSVQTRRSATSPLMARVSDRCRAAIRKK